MDVTKENLTAEEESVKSRGEGNLKGLLGQKKEGGFTEKFGKLFL